MKSLPLLVLHSNMHLNRIRQGVFPAVLPVTHVGGTAALLADNTVRQCTVSVRRNCTYQISLRL